MPGKWFVAIIIEKGIFNDFSVQLTLFVIICLTATSNRIHVTS